MSNDGGKSEGGSQTVEMLRSIGGTVGPLVMAGGGLVGFVALAGSAIVWTRFSALEVPPDQVVAIYPRGELVAIAASLLLLFGLAGLLAVAMCYLIDPKGRASIGMTRGLLCVLGVEGLAVILFIVKAESDQQRYLAGALFLDCLAAIFWLTVFYDRRPAGGRAGRIEFKKKQKWFLVVTLATLVPVLGIFALLHFEHRLEWRYALVGTLLIAAVPTLWGTFVFREGIRRSSRRPGSRRRNRPLGPFEVPFTRKGMYLIALFIGIGVIGPAIVMRSFWLGISLSVAVILFVSLWRAAVMPKKHAFLWFGFAVFVSVPLFGTLTWIAENVFEPQVQPMALIRKSDGADEYLQGLFVAETDSRVYFATVSTEGCSNDLTPSSGRLLWVPKSEIAAIAIGPLQSVSRARRTALEMSYALAPDAASPKLALGASPTGPTAGPQQKPVARRLEGDGAAVQPNFGAGLVLEPPTATAGEEVTLRMAAPNENTRGFGRSRHHRTLRIGGVPVEILKEQAQAAWEAEYVETAEGRTLKLGKQIVYTKTEGDKYVAVSRHNPPHGVPLFVRVSDGSVTSVDDNEKAGGTYLRVVRPERGPVKLALGDEEEHPKVKIRGRGKPVPLKRLLLRQDWHEDHIKFRVPAGSVTGPATIECNQLTTSPLLHVAEPPEARISVKIVPGSPRVVFDSSQSRDINGTITSRHWTVGGLDAGHKRELTEALRPRRQPYSVHLTVVDSGGERGSAHLKLFRLPDHRVHFSHDGKIENQKELKPLVKSVHGAISAEAPESVALEAGAASVRQELDPDVAMADADQLLQTLMSAQGQEPSAASGGLTVRALAFGPRCAPENGGSGRRLDVLVLGQGAQIVPSRRCRPLRSSTAHQLLAPR
jgi:hypothetical protein